MPIRGPAMSWIPVCLSGSEQVPGLLLVPVSTGRFAEQAMLGILALAPQGPATGFLKFCFLEVFISSVLPGEKWHCCHTSLGTYSLVGTPRLWEAGSRGSLAVLPGRDGVTGGCIPLLPAQCRGLIYPACLLPWRAGHQLAEGHFPGISLPSVPIPSAATSQS